MKEINDIRIFANVGINLDVADSKITQEFIRMVRNMRNFDSDGSIGEYVSIMGNVMINDPLLAPGVNKVIGWTQDINKRAIYYFIWNESGNHSIKRLYVDTEIIEDIVSGRWVGGQYFNDKGGQYLNFKRNCRINWANVIGDLLYWTFRYDVGFGESEYNPPRKINVEHARNYTLQSYTRAYFFYPNSDGFIVDSNYIYNNNVYHCTNPVPEVWPSGDQTSNSAWLYVEPYYGGYIYFISQVLEVIKFPPLYAPRADYANDTSVNYNNIRGKLFQFAYRWVYDDGEKSVFSPISKLPLPMGELVASGIFFGDLTKNNKIEIELNPGHDTVKFIEIAARDGNLGNWKLLERIEKFDSDGNAKFNFYDNFTFNFYNTVVGFILDQSDVSDPFHYVPQVAGSQEIIEFNRLVYGDITEGYDNVDIDFLIEYQNRIKSFNEIIPLETVYIHYTNGIAYWDYYKVVLPAQVNDILGKYLFFTFELIVDGNTIYRYLSYYVELNKTIVEVRDGVIDKINDLLKDFDDLYFYDIASTDTVGVPQGSGDNWFYVYLYGYNSTTTSIRNVSGTIIGENPSWKSFKYGAWHNVGIVYLDSAKRSGAVNISETSKVFIPFYSYGNPAAGNDFAAYLKWTINHIPPEWAESYQLVYANSSISWFQQHYVAKEDYEVVVDQLAWRINKNLQANIEGNLSIIIEPYLYEKGDRLRIVGKVWDEANWPILLDAVVDVEIRGGELPEADENDPDKDLNYIIYTELIDAIPIDTYDLIVEIYRPRKQLTGDEETLQYFTIGEEYPILNPHTALRKHSKGADDGTAWAQDQTDSVPAKGIILGGDVYLRARLFGPKSFICEDLNYSDYYFSRSTDRGGTNIVIPEMKRQRYPQRMRFGGIYLQGAPINDLSKFQYTDYESVSYLFGPIIGMREVGFTLKVLQPSKVTSIYIGRQGLQQASQEGVELVSTSSKILGTKYVSEEMYGTNNPESILKVGRDLYFFDVNEGAIIRHATNGMYPISLYGIDGLISQRSKELKESNYEYEVFMGYDSYYKEILISINEFNQGFELINSENQTFGFKDNPINKWSYRISLYGNHKQVQNNPISGIDAMSYLGNKSFVFFSGYPFVQNKSTTPAEFFGTVYDHEIELVFNLSPEVKKVFTSLFIDSNVYWSADQVGDISIPPNSEFLSGMASLLKTNHFQFNEGKLYAPFLRDMYSSSDPINPVAKIGDLFNGRELIGEVLRVKLHTTSTKKVILKSVQVNGLIIRV